jgi:hypothetical protein
LGIVAFGGAFGCALDRIMVMTPEEVEEYCRLHPDDGALLLLCRENGPQLLQYGNCEG